MEGGYFRSEDSDGGSMSRETSFIYDQANQSAAEPLNDNEE